MLSAARPERSMQQVLPSILLGAALAAAGCSWVPARSPDPVEDGASWSSWGSVGHALDGVGRSAAGLRGSDSPVVELAAGMIGAPYRWGGHGPDGFDCSGLVYFAFGEAGIPVPRTSAAQYRAARPVPIAAAQPGDLVFFGRRGRVTHVGIYIGDRRFIHAPDTGQSVRISSINEDYYRARFAGAGRLH
jgi:cell wall-associated NlpC family hydrolase